MEENKKEIQQELQEQLAEDVNKEVAEVEEDEKEVEEKTEKDESKKKVYRNCHLIGQELYKGKKKESKKEKEKKEKYIKEIKNKEEILQKIYNRAKEEKLVGYVEEENDEKKEKKEKPIKFDYLSKNQFKELKKDENIEVEVVGSFNPKKKFKDNKNSVLDIDDFAFDITKKKKIGRTAGYVVVREIEKPEDILYDKFYNSQYQKREDLGEIEEEIEEKKRTVKVVRYYKKSLIPFFLLIMFFVILLGSLWFNRGKISELTGIDLDDMIDWDGENKKNDSQEIKEQTTIPGFVDLKITKDDPEIQLGNPKENTVYFVYTITNKKTNKVVYQTKGIKPGKAVMWNPYDNLKKGTYDLAVVIDAYDLETMRGCNGANQKMKLTLE